jgi:phenylpropionate dioxygenase-like ring-hydroxylating dioxygenase large terminal subunit
MLKIVAADFVTGETPLPVEGLRTPQERKSPPLSHFMPNPAAYLQLETAPYYQPEFLEKEWDRLWTKVWVCAGRVSDVARKGDWFRFDLGRESFIISRSGDDAITAMYNVCQHRANRLVDDDFGHGSAFICPYHSWRFDRAGKCTRVTDREMFNPAALDGALDLPTVRCETWGGFVFINMDPNAGSLAEHIGEVDDIVSGFHVERLEVRADVTVELDCNWKTILDAFSENYHVHITHPAAALISDDKFAQMDFYAGGHTRRIVPIGDPSSRRGQVSTLNPVQEAMLQGLGLDVSALADRPYEVRRAIQLAKRKFTGPFAEAYKDLSDGQLTDDWAMNLFPHTHLSMHAEGVLWMRYYPHRSDPNKCTLHVVTLGQPGIPFEFYLPESPEREANGRPKRQRLRHDDPHLQDKIGLLLFEDVRNTRETQLGIQSAGFKVMRLSEHEQPIMYQHWRIDQFLQAGD